MHADSSEYLAQCDQRRAFISGFNGSAGIDAQIFPSSFAAQDMSLGCAVVTMDNALLFTDGRYFLQAEKQLDELTSFVCFVEIFD